MSLLTLSGWLLGEAYTNNALQRMEHIKIWSKKVIGESTALSYPGCDALAPKSSVYRYLILGKGGLSRIAASGCIHAAWC